ncbi:MAG TPA: hypothetical protein VFE17_02660 [Candidatus Baltobacteraceae bacterium]|jgi:hypothetical protein|nr:hypothetical protein [Candidatus Baltobacteraceae bacterium]
MTQMERVWERIKQTGRFMASRRIGADLSQARETVFGICQDELAATPRTEYVEDFARELVGIVQESWQPVDVLAVQPPNAESGHRLESARCSCGHLVLHHEPSGGCCECRRLGRRCRTEK